MNVIDKEAAKRLGITEMPSHISSGEVGEKKGVGCRSGAAGLLFWFDILELDKGEFRTKDRYDLLGKTPDEVRAM
jgi:hypothetical protein